MGDRGRDGESEKEKEREVARETVTEKERNLFFYI